MEANEPVVVHTTTSFPEAEILKNMLESEGIKCEIEGENQASLVGILEIKILVRSWDEAKARHLLASHLHHAKGNAKKQ